MRLISFFFLILSDYKFLNLELSYFFGIGIGRKKNGGEIKESLKEEEEEEEENEKTNELERKLIRFCHKLKEEGNFSLVEVMILIVLF